jgi:TetR/AcrR family transcriptional regulator, cholesterol catabolism regulator
MARGSATDSRQEILRTAVRLFHRRGYDATSMNDVATALKFSKGGLYHHFQSKDEILFSLMEQAMRIAEERVIEPVRQVGDPEQKLKHLIRCHVEVVLSPYDREISIMLHENHPLPPSLQRKINRRKKDYVHFVEGLVGDVQRARRATRVSARAATFALLGMINWLYQWHRPEGSLNAEQLAQQYTNLFFEGAFG